MDFTHLQNLLQTLQTRPQKIRTLVDYILLNTSQNQLQISKCMEKSFYNLSIDRQLAIFYTISQILIISNQKRQIQFFKVFGTKIKAFLEILNKQISDIRIMKDICRTIQKWQQQQMFSSNFIQKLKSTIKSFYIKVMNQNQDEDKFFGGYKKYKKTFLMQISDIKNYSNCNEIYQLYCQYNDIEQKLVNINSQYQKIDLNKKQINQNDYSIRRSQELVKIYNDLREKLENIIDKIHKAFNNLRKWTMEQYQIFKNDYQIAQ